MCIPAAASSFRSRWILINATMQGKREEGEEEQEGKWIYSWRFSGKGRERLGCAIEQRGFSFFSFFLSFRWGKTGGVGSQKIEEIPCISSPKSLCFIASSKARFFCCGKKRNLSNGGCTDFSPKK